MDFSLDVDLAHVQESLKQTAKSIPQIQKGFLAIIGRGTKKAESKITRQIGGSGVIKGKYPYRVSQAITYHVNREGTKVSIYPKKIGPGRRNDLTIPVISTLNYGKTITPRSISKPYLTFQTKDGQWRKCKSVRIEGLHFIEAGQTYAGSSQYMSDVEKYVQKELDKFWK